MALCQIRPDSRIVSTSIAIYIYLNVLSRSIRHIFTPLHLYTQNFTDNLHTVIMATGPSTKRSSKRYLRWFLAVAVLLALIYSLPQDVSHRLHEKAPFISSIKTPPQARQISAELLLSRPLAHRDHTTIPKIIHQTWFPAGTNMSERAQRWVNTMRGHNPDWEYVLWDDKTNRLLVETHCPWFLEAYDALPQEILRADVIRNLYMFVFGGYVSSFPPLFCLGLLYLSKEEVLTR